MQAAPSPPVMAQQPQNMQPMAAYQPQPKFLEKYGTYSFQRWLMIGVILVVAAAVLNQIPNITGEPSQSDYDDLEKYGEALESYNSLVGTLGALGSIMQSVALGMIGYALIREGYDGNAHHTALRVTVLIGGVLVITNLAANGIDIF
ncbi:MAG: hypothetical protein CL978_07275 [Euryarchaeota archaeon]|nr:hypothetical protein [Euryarchaeota archaeon]MBR95553.1 hypothetical protein [Euryarchaeota archaeon]|tara:strand:+ start:934 stop:1374 length:441 start_codon:yes stop_codon:yes gene_type:complete